jgi:hypothetical protein
LYEQLSMRRKRCADVVPSKDYYNQRATRPSSAATVLLSPIDSANEEAYLLPRSMLRTAADDDPSTCTDAESAM